MTERACAYCTKRLANPSGDLECRARPPVVDVGRFGRFPVVRPTDYCHEGFDLDAKARDALKAQTAETERLDGLVSETQSRAAAEEAVRLRDPDVDDPDDGALKAKRARRARSDVAQDKLL